MWKSNKAVFTQLHAYIRIWYILGGILTVIAIILYISDNLCDLHPCVLVLCLKNIRALNLNEQIAFFKFSFTPPSIHPFIKVNSSCSKLWGARWGIPSWFGIEVVNTLDMSPIYQGRQIHSQPYIKLYSWTIWDNWLRQIQILEAMLKMEPPCLPHIAPYRITVCFTDTERSLKKATVYTARGMTHK